MKLDLAKTQFLIKDGHAKPFRRKRATMLFGKDGPIRPITPKEFSDLKVKYPAETKADGLSIETVWTLQEIT